jgi:membrane protease YdiL (CAAX protease family)
MKEKITFRTKMGNWLGSNLAQWIVILVVIILTFWKDDLSYFLGLAFILLLLWAKRWDWNMIGLHKPKSWKKLWIQSVVISILLLIVVDIMLAPVLEILFGGQPDVSAFDGIRGNFLNYVTFILIMWVIAAFGEEFVYRGLLVERLGILLGNTNTTFWIAVLCSSILFGIGHQYQGISGMVSTGLGAFIFGAIFIKSKNRLWLTILTHGVYDVIGITLIYLDIDKEVFGLLKNLL